MIIIGNVFIHKVSLSLWFQHLPNSPTSGCISIFWSHSQKKSMGFIPLVQAVLLQGRWKREGDFQVGHSVTHIKSACISLLTILYTSLWVTICHFESSVTTGKWLLIKLQILADFYKDSFYLHRQSGYWIRQWLNESTWMSAPIQTRVFTRTTGKLAHARIATALHLIHALQLCCLRTTAETNRGWASKHLQAGKGLLHVHVPSISK